MKAKLIICLFLFSNTAFALTLYKNESAFLVSAPITSTETFDSFDDYTHTDDSQVVLDNVVYTTTDDEFALGHGWTIGSHMGVPGYVTAPNDFGSNEGFPNIITYGEGNYVDAFGFWFLSGAGTNRSWEILVTEENEQTSIFDINFTVGNEQHYYGFLSDTGINKVIVRGKPGSGLANWSFDNVSHSTILGGTPVPDRFGEFIPVPEPSILFLLSAVLIGLGFIRKL